MSRTTRGWPRHAPRWGRVALEDRDLFKLIGGGRPAKGKTKAGHAFWGRVRGDFDAIARKSFGRVKAPGTDGVHWKDLAERTVILCLEDHQDWHGALDGTGGNEAQAAALAAFQALLRKHGLECGKLDDRNLVLTRGR